MVEAVSPVVRARNPLNIPEVKNTITMAELYLSKIKSRVKSIEIKVKRNSEKLLYFQV